MTEHRRIGATIRFSLEFGAKLIYITLKMPIYSSLIALAANLISNSIPSLRNLSIEIYHVLATLNVLPRSNAHSRLKGELKWRDPATSFTPISFLYRINF